MNKGMNPLDQDEDFFLPKSPTATEPKTKTTPEQDAADVAYLQHKMFRALKDADKYANEAPEAKLRRTFDELGIKGFRAMRKMLLVRTEALPQKIGLIYVPPKLATFYGELPHLQNIYAMVLAAGPKADCKPLDRVVFQRLYFARWQHMEDGTVVGWIDEANVYGRG